MVNWKVGFFVVGVFLAGLLIGIGIVELTALGAIFARVPTLSNPVTIGALLGLVLMVIVCFIIPSPIKDEIANSMKLVKNTRRGRKG